MTEPDPLMTTTEVARYFHVDPKTVRRWVKEGKLQAIKPGDGELRFSRATLPPIEPLDQNQEETP